MYVIKGEKSSRRDLNNHFFIREPDGRRLREVRKFIKIPPVEKKRQILYRILLTYKEQKHFLQLKKCC
jgi:hypothetical protein